MREKYPFFRDADEQTRAVIGAEAADADLNGSYQKPYAILSDKRLYCKNEQGNFIADGKTVRMAGGEKSKRPLLSLVSVLLLVAIVLVQFPGGYSIDLLTLQTQRDAKNVQTYLDYQEEAEKLEAELTDVNISLSQEELSAFSTYLNQYSDKELARIYEECGLDRLSGGQGAALGILQNAEAYLEKSTSEMEQEAKEALLALLTSKFDPELGVMLSECRISYLSRGFHEYYPAGDSIHQVISNLSAEAKELFCQVCQKDMETEMINYSYSPFYIQRRFQHDFSAFVFDVSLSMAYYEARLQTDRDAVESYLMGNLNAISAEEAAQVWLEWIRFLNDPPPDFWELGDIIKKPGKIDEETLKELLIQHEQLYREFAALLPMGTDYLYDGEGVFRCGIEGSITDVFLWLYSTYAYDGASPQDFLDLLELIYSSDEYAEYPADAWNNANSGEISGSAQLPTMEALTAISQYTQEERENLLYPLSRTGTDDLTSVRNYQEKQSRLERAQNYRLYGNANYMYWDVSSGYTTVGQLNRSAFFATLCALVAVVGAVALLVLFALNLGKLASFVGMGAGVLAAVASLLSDPGILGYSPSALLRFGPVALGLGAAVVSVLVFLKLMKAAAVPTFRLVTSAGTFTFREKDYPKAEREAFAAALSHGEGE